MPLGSHGLVSWSPVAANHRRAMYLLWAIFLFRAAFYGSFTPLWEGFDEHAHFGYIQLLRAERRLPVAASDRISAEIYSSLKLAPLPWQPRGFRIGLSHDDYWKLNEGERHSREAQLRVLDPSLAVQQIQEDRHNPFLSLYESQHPPLYYALCLIPYSLAGHFNLIDRIFLIRVFSILAASGLIPLAFYLLRQFLKDRDSLLVVWTIAFFPGLMFDIVRVGNESLAVLLFTLLVLLSLRGVKSRKQALMIGLVLGLGLLTKSSFLTAVTPVGIALLLPQGPDRPLRTRLGDLGVAAFGAVSLSAWWYLLMHSNTGSWTGLYFNTAVAQWSSLVQAARSIDWLNAFNAILSSHVWFGNWSFLRLRGWIYQLVTIAFLLGVMGAGLRLVQNFFLSTQNRYRFLVAVVFYAFFWLGLGYHALLTYAATGVHATAGWYLNTAIGSEFLILVAGWTFLLKARTIRVAATAALGVTIIDLYGTFFLLIPYYTGFISHDGRGFVSSFKPWTLSLADYAELLSRLTVNKSAAMTTEYFIGSAALFVLIGIGSVAAAIWFLFQGKVDESVPGGLTAPVSRSNPNA